MTFFVLALTGCRDEEDLIPYVPVNLVLYLDQYNQLAPVTGAILISGGVNGIIVYHESEAVYTAFDRTCTHEPQGNCAVSLEPGNMIAACPCCDSEFYIVFRGDVKEGPARYPLKEYSVSYDVYNNALYITN